MSGRLAAMAIGVVGAPIIARLFAPEHYGVAAFFIAVASILAGILPFGYQRAVLFPPSDQVAAQLLRLVFAIATVGSVSLFGVLAVMDVAGQAIPGPLAGSSLIWLLPIAALLMAIRDALNVLMIRGQRYAAVAWADVLQSGSTLVGRAIWGLVLGSAAFGLVLGQLAGVIASALVFLTAGWKWLRTNLRAEGAPNLVSLALEFGDYPKYRVFARLAFVAAEQLPVLALGVMFPADKVGFFAMAQRVADLPLQAASRALGDAILGNSISKRHHSEALGPGTWKAAVGLAAIGLPTFSVMFLFGGEMLTWFLGPPWSEAGSIVEILAVYLFFSWMNAPFAPIFETLRMNRQYMLLYILNLLARLTVFVACYIAALDMSTTLWAFSITCACHSLVSITVAISVVRRHDAGLRIR